MIYEPPPPIRVHDNETLDLRYFQSDSKCEDVLDDRISYT